MNDFTGLDINDIYVIIQKFETDCFNFETTSRQWDGFTLITSGSGLAQDKHGNVYTLDKGDILHLRRGDAYKISFSQSCSYITSAFNFRFDYDGEFPCIVPFKERCSDEDIKNIYRVCQMWQSHSLESYTKCRIMLLEYYLRIIQKRYKKTSERKGVSLAIEYIHKNFKRNFSGEDIAKYCSVSLSYLRASFFKEIGLTVIAYRDKLRIKSAEEMLMSKYFTIKEIACELGYCDIYHFSKTFKKHTGISPGTFAKNKNRL